MPASESELNASDATKIVVFDCDGEEKALADFVVSGPAVFVFLRQFG